MRKIAMKKPPGIKMHLRYTSTDGYRHALSNLPGKWLTLDEASTAAKEFFAGLSWRIAKMMENEKKENSDSVV